MTSSIRWDDEKLKAAGLDKKKLWALVRRLRKCGKDMQAMGLEVYGSGSGYLIHKSHPTHNEKEKADKTSVVAELGPGYNGGDW